MNFLWRISMETIKREGAGWEGRVSLRSRDKNSSALESFKLFPRKLSSAVFIMLKIALSWENTVIPTPSMMRQKTGCRTGKLSYAKTDVDSAWLQHCRSAASQPSTYKARIYECKLERKHKPEESKSNAISIYRRSLIEERSKIYGNKVVATRASCQCVIIISMCLPAPGFITSRHFFIWRSLANDAIENTLL